MRKGPYFGQALLMLRLIPHISSEECFALKGGTAINLFLRDMPRLSVDIDLAYLPVDDERDKALTNIGNALARIAVAIKRALPRAKIQEGRAHGSRRTSKLVVTNESTRIIIEPNEVMRGAVWAPAERELTKRAEEMFELSVTARTLSTADLYGGKICAALDRQHPRDLFDIKVLLQNEGITDEIRKAFVVYLACHDRPISELLNPAPKDLLKTYESEFAGMSGDNIGYVDLVAARDALVKTLLRDLTAAEKVFLVSIKEGQPKWDQLGLKGIEKLPAIQWKLMNIQKIKKDKHAESLSKLKEALGL